MRLRLWRADPHTLNESIRRVRDFLNEKLAKCKSWEDVRAQNKLRPIFDSEPQFRSVKGQGVGETTILKYLDGVCTQGEVRYAIALSCLLARPWQHV